MRMLVRMLLSSGSAQPARAMSYTSSSSVIRYRRLELEEPRTVEGTLAAAKDAFPADQARARADQADADAVLVRLGAPELDGLLAP